MQSKVIRTIAGVAVFCLWGISLLDVFLPNGLSGLAMIRPAQTQSEALYELADPAIPLASAAQDNGVSGHGQLSVANGGLVDSAGEPVQLRGMSSHGLAWYPQYTQSASIGSTRAYGANVFRIAMYVDQDSGNYTMKSADRNKNREAMYAAIDNTLGLDMYAIADWHMLEEENPMDRVDCAVEFFAELSQQYAGEPGLIYEICNEPNGDTTWDDVYEYASLVVPTIREHSPEAVIIVGTPSHSTDLRGAIENPVPYDNVLYAYHYYTGIAKGDYAQNLQNAIDAGLPIFISEWGMGSEENKDELEMEHAVSFLDYLKENGISWTNWSLSNKDESFSAIRSDVSKLSGWTYSDLTDSGKIVFEAFGG